MTRESLNDRFAVRMGALLGPDFPDTIGLAVSGGGDSMAMLALSHEWARHMGVRLSVVTVDHGLRAASADEARLVAAECEVLGHPHATLHWTWDGTGNLQDAARRARLELIGAWRGEIGHVLFAHTRDDQAETVLMRLMRGSGVDGLAAMAEARAVRMPGTDGLPGNATWTLLRPLLDESRATLRHYADTLRVPYADDPSNDDPRFDRVRVRQAMRALGLDAASLTATADRMQRARTALEARTAEVAARIAREGTALGLPTGIAEIARDGFATIERETQLRLMARAIGWVTGAAYRPRAAALEDAIDRTLGGGGTTLGGARIVVGRSRIHVFREYAAVDGRTVVAGGAVWDGRWHLSGHAVDGMTVRALGEDGWRQIPQKQGDTPPHALALSLPAVYDGPRLVACAHFGFGPPHDLRLIPPAGSFVAGENPH